MRPKTFVVVLDSSHLYIDWTVVLPLLSSCRYSYFLAFMAVFLHLPPLSIHPVCSVFTAPRVQLLSDVQAGHCYLLLTDSDYVHSYSVIYACKSHQLQSKTSTKRPKKTALETKRGGRCHFCYLHPLFYGTICRPAPHSF